MRTGTRAITVLGLVLTAACQSAKSDEAAPEPTEQDAAMEMSQEEMFAMMTELGTPSEGHRRLDPMVGEFDATVRMWMAPGAPPDESTGRCKNEWVLGGRYLHTAYQGSMMGQEFAGFALTGYNNSTSQYEGIWVDSTSTYIMSPSRGSVDESGKVFEFHRTVDNMFPGQTSTMREVTTIVDENRHTMEMFEVHADGTETRTLEIVYTRR